MKKDTIVISLEAEKLRAIKKYMEKKEADLQAEMEDQLQKLYEKYVPANVREYIDAILWVGVEQRYPLKSFEQNLGCICDR